jgi:hypothetical protein
MSRHGTTRAYRLGCRCDECKAAKKTAASAERERMRQRAITGEPAPIGRPSIPLSERPHGSYVTYSKGCRCQPCTEANSDYGRERKAERELAQWERMGVLEP